ncbi:hypothetical protein EJ03DRAFT_388606 [Teratosphaeria nubilosa]|uniref:Early meiotic induction protein 1 n=1 Tax=Teratosphaeria nubilosa TaxID=161662 RepID=A0A6G1LDU9_9PEZI|nr:hypothetical protein EJ03DRAFT_388606 [Teratosphaeria nubilosa]
MKNCDWDTALQPSGSGSREEKADAELDAFLKSLESPTGAAATNEPAHNHIEPDTPKPATHDRLLPDGSLNIHPDALYPVTMSCRQAFDQAVYCQSLGGKFNDIYRYGQLKDCGEHWGAFWFCMRNRTLPAKDKEHQIREYYRLRDEKRKKEFGSSENIWDIREKPVERAFWRDPDADDGDGRSPQPVT